MQAPAALESNKEVSVSNCVAKDEVEHIPAPALAAPAAGAFPLAQPALALPTGPVATFKETFAPFTLAGLHADCCITAELTWMLAPDHREQSPACRELSSGQCMALYEPCPMHFRGLRNRSE